ncbi:hypothetical protein TNCT_634431 [Trichonephila clavata]|uniref:Uncharacterized protein n=1 Tax=Trichonephila clavata TaxID=2740835 RepID=A0A8X6FN13_TRICU|nr:hypothetical protein TNCT_634431 [Trichonephila clavata]
MLSEDVFSFRVGNDWEGNGSLMYGRLREKRTATAMERVARVVRLASEGGGIEEFAGQEEKSFGITPPSGCYARLVGVLGRSTPSFRPDDCSTREGGTLMGKWLGGLHGHLAKGLVLGLLRREGRL